MIGSKNYSLAFLAEVFLKVSTNRSSFFTWLFRATLILLPKWRCVYFNNVIYFMSLESSVFTHSKRSAYPLIPFFGSFNNTSTLLCSSSERILFHTPPPRPWFCKGEIPHFLYSFR